jgi:F-type H+-transporting ATPase subunit b
MTIDWWTLALQAGNFVVLAWLLQRFLYRPVLAAIDRRRAETTAARDKAAAAELRAAEAESDWRARVDAVEAERAAVLRRAEAEAARRAEDIMAEARRQSDAVLAQARATIAAEREQAAAELGGVAAGVATTLAARLLEAAAPGVGPAPFLAALVERLAAMDAVDRRLLAAGPLTLGVAPALEAQEDWRRHLYAALGAEPEMTVVDSPALIAGARLAAPAMALEVSWAQALAAARQEMADVDAG